MPGTGRFVPLLGCVLRTGRSLTRKKAPRRASYKVTFVTPEAETDVQVAWDEYLLSAADRMASNSRLPVSRGGALPARVASRMGRWTSPKPSASFRRMKRRATCCFAVRTPAQTSEFGHTRRHSCAAFARLMGCRPRKAEHHGGTRPAAGCSGSGVTAVGSEGQRFSETMEDLLSASGIRWTQPMVGWRSRSASDSPWWAGAPARQATYQDGGDRGLRRTSA